MRRNNRFLSGIVTASLAVGVVTLTATPASAAYDEFRPGAEAPTMESTSSWKPSSPTTHVAQPFIQPESGYLDSFSVEVFDIPTGHEIESAALHEFTTADGPSETPIAGGIDVSISYTPGEEGKIWAVISFTDRPFLTEGEHYALIIDPYANPTEAVSFPIPLAFGADPNTHPWQQSDGVWYGYGNAHHLIFTSELVTSFGEPSEPTLVAADECGVESSVEIPTSEGVEYTSERDGNNVTVTATAAAGYELAADAQTTWTFDVTATDCASEPDEESEPEDSEPEDPQTQDAVPVESQDHDDPKLTAIGSSEAELAATGNSMTPATALGAFLLLGGALAIAVSRRYVRRA